MAIFLRLSVERGELCGGSLTIVSLREGHEPVPVSFSTLARFDSDELLDICRVGREQTAQRRSGATDGGMGADAKSCAGWRSDWLAARCGGGVASRQEPSSTFGEGIRDSNP